MNYSGEWHDILVANLQSHYIYKNGDEVSSITGGWTTDFTIHTSIPKGGTVTKEKSDIKIISASSSRYGAGVITFNPIDLTTFSELTVKYNIDDLEKITTLDIKSLLTSYYIFIYFESTVISGESSIRGNASRVQIGITSTKTLIHDNSVKNAEPDDYSGFSKTMYIKEILLS